MTVRACFALVLVWLLAYVDIIYGVALGLTVGGDLGQRGVPYAAVAVASAVVTGLVSVLVATVRLPGGRTSLDVAAGLAARVADWGGLSWSTTRDS